MQRQPRILGVPVHTRGRRRALITAVCLGYGALTLMAALGAAWLRPLMPAVLGLFVMGSWLAVAVVARPIADDADEALDERQRAQRNAAYLEAYRVVAAAFALSTVYAAIATDKGYPMPHDYVQWSVLGWGVFLLVLILPGALLAWREPDADEDESRASGRARGLSVAALLMGAVGAGPLHGQAAAPAALTPELAAATFDSVWTRVDRTYYDPAFRGVNWAAARDELRPRAVAAASRAELHQVLESLVGRLGDSHFGIIPREAADALAGGGEGGAGDAGLEIRLVDGRVVVSRVDAGGPAARAGIAPGWTVERIAGRPTGGAVAALLRIRNPAQRRAAELGLLAGMAARMQGTPGTTLTLALRNGSRARTEHTLVLRATLGQEVRFGNLPPVMARLDHHRVALPGGECAGVIRMNIWMPVLAAEMARAVDAHRGCRGIVVDLRGNPGGVAGMIMGVAGHFLPDTASLGVMRLRGSTLRMVANPQRAGADGRPVVPFDGRLAVLVDGMSASTSEFFAAGLQALGRARVFGEPSAGQALPALMGRLPTGDVLMHPFADYTLPDGTRIEGAGVQPDSGQPLLAADLRAGRDRPLNAALAWIAASGIQR